MMRPLIPRHVARSPFCFTTDFKPLGFKDVTLDLESYRQGSLNEVLR
jgi:PP-loop superfamily ATP-utilizing enzyme